MMNSLNCWGGCQTGQCDPSELFLYSKDEDNLLQLQFHHIGTAFWTWSRHSMRCHYRDPRGTVHTWGQEDRSCLKLTLEHISINCSWCMHPAHCKKWVFSAFTSIISTSSSPSETLSCSLGPGSSYNRSGFELTVTCSIKHLLLICP